MIVKNNIFEPRFGRFLVVGWSDWADSFCIVSGFLRHKFRLPTKGILETKKFGLFLRYTPFEGTWKKIFRQKKYFPNWPYNIGNQIRWVRINFMTKRGEWDTLGWHMCWRYKLSGRLSMHTPWSQDPHRHHSYLVLYPHSLNISTPSSTPPTLLIGTH